MNSFKRLALTLRAHWKGILNAFDSHLTNGRVDALNAHIQAACERLSRTSRNLITMAYLVGATLSHLPDIYRYTSTHNISCRRRLRP